ncbi:MAG: glycosyltransferase [Chitinophagaceae bacterium]|nr:glycosyltransferase [Chitinophagaceae bacterium]
MITYNHQDFISQALDSILNQKDNFSFEIVIGNDGSKDNTGRICASYALEIS